MSVNCHANGWTCGTPHAYNRHHCRCDACRKAKMQYRFRYHGQPPPTHNRWGYITYHCPCPICGDDYNAYQRERRAARGARPRATRTSRRRAAEAIGAALQSLPQRPTLTALRLLAKRKGRVIYLIGIKATLRRPFAGPYLEVWPSGNVSHVGPGGDNRPTTRHIAAA